MTPLLAEGINWPSVLIEAAFIVVPLLLAGYIAYRHVIWTLREFRPHIHQERRGPLYVDGIRYPRSMEGAD